MRGYFSMVLHSHMPYVRKNGAWPVGEDWLYQVMSDTYMPLIAMLAQLEEEGITSCLGLTLTPVLCDQLADSYLKEQFAAYLQTMIDRAEADVRDFEYFADAERAALAEAYRDDYRSKLLAFLAIDGDILGVLRSFERAGLIETMASSATHAFLPGLADWRSVEAQVRVGIDSHRLYMDKQPAGFWIPECAYRKGLAKLLEHEGIRYVLLDHSAVEGLDPHFPYLIGGSDVAVIARSELAHYNVWDDHGGYPRDGRYVDSTKYYEKSGLHYWRVTAPEVPIEEKEVYNPAAAQERALDHAGHFMKEVAQELYTAGGFGLQETPSPDIFEASSPIVLASYDTELFGHGWREGVYWLEVLLRSLAGSKSIIMTTPSAYISRNKASHSISLRETSWGTNRDHSTWINEGTSWMWEKLENAQMRLFRLREAGGGELIERVIAQAAREVILLESSDWPYMVAKDRAKGYSIERFSAHLERFDEIATALERGDLESLESTLVEIEDVDNVFAELDLELVFGSRAPPGEGR